MTIINKTIKMKSIAASITLMLCALFLLVFPGKSPAAAVDLNGVWWEGDETFTLTYSGSSLSGACHSFNSSTQYIGEEDGYMKYKGICSYAVGGSDTFEFWYDPNVPHRITYFIYSERADGSKEYTAYNCPIYRYVEQRLTIEKDSAAEPSTTARFFITRSHWEKKKRNIGCSLSGTAVQGADYKIFPEDLKFEEEQQSAMFTLTPIDDQEVEGPETVVIEIVKDFRTDEIERGVITIADNDSDNNDPGDPPEKNVVRVIKDYPYAYELDAVKGRFIFSRTGSTESDLLVAYSINGTAQNGVDYGYILDTITIPAGEESATLTIAPYSDQIPEEDETVIISLDEKQSYQIDPLNSMAEINIIDHNGGPAQEFPFEENVSPTREWNIICNRSVDSASVSPRNIYVTDSTGYPVRVNVDAGDNDRSIKVTPLEGGYHPGQTYKLYINNLKSGDGKPLKCPYVKSFTISNN